MDSATCICGTHFFPGIRGHQKCKKCREGHPPKRLGRIMREFKAEGHHSNSEFWKVIGQQHGCCFWCGEYLFAKKEFIGTRDHLIPLVRGGSDWIENIVAACRSCNSSKGTMTAEEYRAVLEERARERNPKPPQGSATTKNVFDLENPSHVEIIAAMPAQLRLAFAKLSASKAMEPERKAIA
jgi:5-methylcytosine-specific restriction endonuclease McrA